MKRGRPSPSKSRDDKEPSTSGSPSTSRQNQSQGTRRFWEEKRAKTSSLQNQEGIFRKLRSRECFAAQPSSAISVIRRMCIDIYPSKSVVAKKIPEFHVRTFTPDGRFLVCFSLNLKSVILYRYRREDHRVPQRGSTTFETFFRKVFELEVAAEDESLCKTFCLTTNQGRFLFLSSSTKSNTNTNAEKIPTFDKVSFHVIDLDRGMKCDELTFEKDFIWLTQNNGVCLYEDTIGILSVKNQVIHFFKVNFLGKLVKMRSIGDFIYEDDERMLQLHKLEQEAYNNNSERNPGYPYSEAMEEGEHGEMTRPYSGIKQRLLGYLVKNALKTEGKPGENEDLKRFFFHFKDYNSLLMWKIQMLDSVHLLIKFDKSTFLGNGDLQSGYAQYSGVFNIMSGKFICFFLNRNEEIASLYQNFTDFFRVTSDGHLWSRFVSSYSNDPFLRAQLDKQRDRYNKIYGSELELSKQISSFLPLSPQMTSSSPYLDARLFQFDDRYVSPYVCPKPVAEHAIKFLTRGLHSSTRFKIDPSPGSDDEDERDGDNYVTYIFHPVYPFAISSICSHMQQTPKIMKFYFR